VPDFLISTLTGQATRFPDHVRVLLTLTLLSLLPLCQFYFTRNQGPPGPVAPGPAGQTGKKRGRHRGLYGFCDGKR
jgi:hypothetical protein